MIEKITVKINKKKIELSLEEAKKLYEDLNGMFGSEKTYIPYYPPYQPYYPVQPQSPWYIYTDNTHTWTNGFTLTA